MGLGTGGTVGSATSTTADPATSSGPDGGSTTEVETMGECEDCPDALPPLAFAPLTTEQVLTPDTAVAKEALLDPRVPENREQLLGKGYGDYSVGAGEPVLDRMMGVDVPPPAGPQAALLTRFMHLADIQLADDESPTRSLTADLPTAITGGFRPQEAYGCQILNAATRTINAVNLDHALDFVLLGGDNADSAQANEVDWLQRVLDGAAFVECDSGDDDDPVAGPGNDPKDAFRPVGLDVPWRWVTGNHDVLVQGNFRIEDHLANAVGSNVVTQTRDWSQPGGPPTSDPVPADERRALLDNAALLTMISQSGDGHGIEQATLDYGKAYYTFDIEGAPIRVLVVDTTALSGAAGGLILEDDVEGFVRPALDAADAEGLWVIVTSHHGSTSLTDGGGFGGMAQAGAWTTEEWQALLGEYNNILMHLAAHTHVHQAEVIEPPGGTPYWEVHTSALADYPHQMRMIEVRDEDNGYLSITGIAVDFATDDDAMAEAGRANAILDYTSGWQPPGQGMALDRNVRLWLPMP